MNLGSLVSLPKNLNTLTASRFFAALMIIVHHYYDVFDADVSSVFHNKTYLGVDFFFILSGFILLHVYFEPLKNGSLNIKSFYIKRLAKIYPVHLILTAVFFLLLVIAGNVDKAAVFSFLSHIFLIHAWGVESGLGYNSPSWSVSAEWFVYLLFPFMAPLILKFDRHPVVLLSASFGCFLIIWVLSNICADKPVTEWTYHFSILRIVPEFLLGMAVYNFIKYYGTFRKSGYLAIGSVFLSGLLIVLSFPDWSVVIAFVLVIYALAGFEMSGCRAFVFLGEASYCLYMIHFIILLAFVPFFEKGIAAHIFYSLMSVYIGLSIAASGLLYVYVETPLRHWITNKFIK